MIVHPASFTIATAGKGVMKFTDRVAAEVVASGVAAGAVTVFVRHTNCSLIIMDNADPTAGRDLEEFFERLVPGGHALLRAHRGRWRRPQLAHSLRPDALSSEVIPIAAGPV